MLELNRLYVMDCMEGLKKIPSETAQIIIADPPYNIGKNFGNNFDKLEMDEYLEWCDSWIKECIRILKPNGTMFIYGFSETLAYIFVRISINKKWLIWHYTNKNIPSLNFWQRSHESIISCWKNDKKFNKDDIREPYTEGFINGSAGKKRPNTKGRFSNSNNKTTIYKAHKNGALPRDVIKIPTLAGGSGVNERWFICNTCDKICSPKEIKKHRDHNIEKHPTQKPLNLCDKLILSCTQEKGIVVIPFVGSGSECVSAKKMGLDFIGFDLNKKYIELSNKRLKEIKIQKNLL